MSTKKRGDEIRQFILQHIDAHPVDIVSVISEQFSISRQAVNKHMQRLIQQKLLSVEGNNRKRTYKLIALTEWIKSFPLDGSIAEDIVWRDSVAPYLNELPENVRDIWHYGMTEMFNNAIDHSAGTMADVHLEKYSEYIEITLYDDGEGIFKKIQRELNLQDERHSVLELAKGKLTTDPANHSGEGIFFSSRMFDKFIILSGGVYFSHNYGEAKDYILQTESFHAGTYVVMRLSNNATRTMTEVFDYFTSADDYGFTKTVVPVDLAQYGDDKLISRSQAKRLLVRIDKFKTVILDFKGVESVGQAFADEIFRVFANHNPGIELIEINANQAVSQMIQRAKSHS